MLQKLRPNRFSVRISYLFSLFTYLESYWVYKQNMNVTKSSNNDFIFYLFQLLPPELSFCNNNRRQKSLTKVNWNSQILVCAKKIAWWQKKNPFCPKFCCRRLSSERMKKKNDPSPPPSLLPKHEKKNK